MRALLGTIQNIHLHENAADEWTIAWKPRCVLPDYKPVPDWLKDQTLTTTRRVADKTELGQRDDAFVLSVEESKPYLYPLSIEPEIAHNHWPGEVVLHLHWWKDATPPKWTIRVAGRTQTGDWEKQHEGWRARISLDQSTLNRPLSDEAPRLEAACDALRVECVLLPSQTPLAARMVQHEGEVTRLETAWLSVDITARHGGAISAWRERGREVDFFATPQNLVQTPLDWAGHTDRYKTTPWGNWSEKMADCTLDGRELRRTAQGHCLHLAGIVDSDDHLRTSVSYTLLDNWPLLILERNWQLAIPKLDTSKDARPDELKTPIDHARTLQMSFRSAAAPDTRAPDFDHQSTLMAENLSRVLCADGERLSVTRGMEAGELRLHENWAMHDGWALFEHPQRREHLLYLFDTHAPPHMAMWRGARVVTLEPFWAAQTVRPGEGLGFAIAISSGEVCGASAAGCWVATRIQGAERTVCAVIGRFREDSNVFAHIRIGQQKREVSLQSTLIPGIGDIFCARTEFEGVEFGDGKNEVFDAEVGGVASRGSRRLM